MGECLIRKTGEAEILEFLELKVFSWLNNPLIHGGSLIFFYEIHTDFDYHFYFMFIFIFIFDAFKFICIPIAIP